MAELRFEVPAFLGYIFHIYNITLGLLLPPLWGSSQRPLGHCSVPQFRHLECHVSAAGPGLWALRIGLGRPWGKKGLFTLGGG